MKRILLIAVLVSVAITGFRAYAGGAKGMAKDLVVGSDVYSLSTDYVVINESIDVAEIVLLKNGQPDYTTPYSIQISPYNFCINGRGDWFGNSETSGPMYVTRADLSDPYAYGTFDVLIGSWGVVGTVTVHHGYW